MGLLRACVLSIVFLGIAGCGGSPGGGSGSGGAAGNSTTVTFTFQGPTPTAVAARIGSGAFALQSLNSGTLLLSVPGGTSDFAVAFVCPLTGITAGGVQIGQTVEESIVQATLSDGTSFTESCLPVPPTFQAGILTGSVDASPIPGASFVTINAQNGESGASTTLTDLATNFSFSAPAGANRVEVLAFRSTAQSGLESTALLTAKNFSNQAVPGVLNEGNPVVLSASDKTTTAPIAYNNVPAGFTSVSTLVSYEMGGGGSFVIADGATNQYPVLPAGAAQPGDRYAFLARARNNLQTLSSSAYQIPAGPISFTFPPPWSYAGPSPSALPVFDFDYSGFAGNAYIAGAASVGWWTGSYSDKTFLEHIVSVTAAPTRLRPIERMAVPDLSLLPGFLPNPPSGTQVSWAAGISTADWSVVQNGLSTAGYGSVQNGGVFTVP